MPPSASSSEPLKKANRGGALPRHSVVAFSSIDQLHCKALMKVGASWRMHRMVGVCLLSSTGQGTAWAGCTGKAAPAIGKGDWDDPCNPCRWMDLCDSGRCAGTSLDGNNYVAGRELRRLGNLLAAGGVSSG